jgi:alpha-tubulin suppressor-like RCC1 family protein
MLRLFFVLASPCPLYILYKTYVLTDAGRRIFSSVALTQGDDIMDGTKMGSKRNGKAIVAIFAATIMVAAVIPLVFADGDTDESADGTLFADIPLGAGTTTPMVAAGGNHSLALTSTGEVWAWGDNNQGQLGDGTNTSKNTPVQVKGVGGTGYLTDVIAISAGGSHSLALKLDGTVWAWGYNEYGQLGDGTTVNKNAPVQVLKGASVSGSAYLSKVTAIAAGGNHSLALNEDKQVWAWGANAFGQLGDDTNVNKDTPVQVKGLGGYSFLNGIVAIAAGSNHSLTLNNSGAVYTWGYNNYGQLGDDTTANKRVPVLVRGVGGSGNMSGVTAIAAGNNHSLAVKNDGTVWAWGQGGNGRLGDGSATTRTTPVAPKAVVIFKSVNNTSVVSGDGGAFIVNTSAFPKSPTYSLTGAPSGVTINAATGVMSVPSSVAAGSYSFTVNANNGASAQQTFTLNVTAGSSGGGGDGGIDTTLIIVIAVAAIAAIGGAAFFILRR